MNSVRSIRPTNALIPEPSSVCSCVWRWGRGNWLARGNPWADHLELLLHPDWVSMGSALTCGGCPSRRKITHESRRDQPLTRDRNSQRRLTLSDLRSVVFD